MRNFASFTFALALFVFLATAEGETGEDWMQYVDNDVSKQSEKFGIIFSSLFESMFELQGNTVEMFMKLRYLYLKTKEDRKQHPPRPESQIQDKQLIDEMVFWVQFIEATYGEGDDQLVEQTTISHEDIVASDWISEALEPAYYIARIHSKKVILLAIRGTASVGDALTDITTSTNKISLGGIEGAVHRGFHLSASYFVENVLGLMRKEVDKYPGYSMKVVGHSLGGATAAVSALLFKEEGADVSAFVLAPACSLTRELALDAAKIVTTVVHGDDVVSRFSIGAIEKLRTKLDWIETVLSDENQDMIKELRKQREEAAEKLWEASAVIIDDVGEKVGYFDNFLSGMFFEGGEYAEVEESEGGEADEPQGLGTIFNFAFEAIKLPEPLYPPGRGYHLYKAKFEGEGHDDDDGDDEDGEEWRYVLKERSTDQFEHIEITDTMLTDHFCVGYREGLGQVQKSVLLRDEL